MDAPESTAVTEVRPHVGTWLDGRFVVELNNPADTRSLVATVAQADVATAQQAAETAANAVDRWAHTPAPVRGEILGVAAGLLADRAETIATTMSREMGKIIEEARAEVTRSIDILRFFAQQPRIIAGQTFPLAREAETAFTLRVPLGAVALITPWNFPLSIPTWKAAAALAYGNTVVLKPAEASPCSAEALVRALLDAGLPPEVLSFVPGSGVELGPALLSSPAINGVSFTGSTAVGRTIVRAAAARGIPAQCELGGRNAVVVLADADLDAALDAVLLGGFGTNGQRCTSSSRVIVERSVADVFAKRLVTATEGIVVGNGLDPATDLGPLISATALDNVLSGLARAVDEGSEILIGGTRLTHAGLEHGHFMAPTITRTPANSWFAGHEVFGPVVSLFEVDDFDEAVRLNNAVDYGLSSSIYTRNLTAAMRFVHEADSGMIHVNRPTVGAEVHVPFGGTKDSSYGPREMGGAYEFYSKSRSAHVRWM